MTRIIKISVTCKDDSDADWLVTKCQAAVEETVADARDDGRLDGEVDVDMDIDYGD